MTKEQANFVYKKTESGKMINTKTLKQELKHERQLNKIDDTSGDTKPYKELIVKYIKGRISRCVQGNPVRNTKYLKI